MANQKSLTDLKDQAESVHKNEFGKPLYDYQNVKYAFQNKGIWEIRCDLHSTTFFQNFRKHLSGQTGCKECSAENKRKNSFIERRENFLKKQKHREKNNINKYVYVSKTNSKYVLKNGIENSMYVTPY
jgi:hypothetical protein